MIEIPREVIASEDIEDKKIALLLKNKAAVYWAEILINEEVLICIEGRDPTVVMYFSPEKIPSVLAKLWELNEVPKALAIHWNEMVQKYMDVSSKLARPIHG